jgi:SAM-dependent methyltransferase
MGRAGAYGQHRRPTPVDRFGVWLSSVAVRRHADFKGRRVGDFGCGYEATFVRTVLGEVASATLIDVALADDLRRHPKVRAIEGSLPEALEELEDGSLEVILCLSVLEHLWEPQRALREMHRLLAPGGIVLINVPSWRGKRFLEFAAFRLGLSPREEMEDHKNYFDPRDLWPLLIRAGFQPSHVRCHRHKFGLNTFAACRVSEAEA